MQIYWIPEILLPVPPAFQDAGARFPRIDSTNFVTLVADCENNREPSNS